MMNKLNIFLLFLIILLSSGQNVHAKIDSRATIENFAKQAITLHYQAMNSDDISVKISPIDPRIAIKPCQSELQADFPQQQNSRTINVKIMCNDQEPWQLYLSARVISLVNVVVATKRIYKGSLLDDSNIAIKKIDSQKLRGETIQDISMLIGSKSTRTIQKGKPVNMKYICLVCKNDPVTISVDYHGLQIKTQGIAMANGSIGDDILIRNKQTGKLVTAQVISLNKVKVFL